jgi:hypothetical protein
MDIPHIPLNPHIPLSVRDLTVKEVVCGWFTLRNCTMQHRDKFLSVCEHEVGRQSHA